MEKEIYVVTYGSYNEDGGLYCEPLGTFEDGKDKDGNVVTAKDKAYDCVRHAIKQDEEDNHKGETVYKGNGKWVFIDEWGIEQRMYRAEPMKVL